MVLRRAHARFAYNILLQHATNVTTKLAPAKEEGKELHNYLSMGELFIALFHNDTLRSLHSPRHSAKDSNLITSRAKSLIPAIKELQLITQSGY